MVLPFAGALFTAQTGTGITTAAVVNVVALVVPQPVAAPFAFLGAIYQLYNVEAVKPVTSYVLVATLAVGDAGGVAPVQIYTSYDVAVAADGHVSVAVVCVAIVLAFAGDVLITQSGRPVAVVNTVVLVVLQVALAPLAFLGAIYQL